jgi:threonine/homoserine/homoserine lactone efflux protein
MQNIFSFPRHWTLQFGVLIAWIVAFGMSSLGRFYNRVNQFQKWLNLIVAVAFILAGIYYFVIYYI